MRPDYPRPIRALLGMALLSSLGSGLTLPFLLVYLHDDRHISLAATGLLIAVPAVVGLLATPFLGAIIDATGVRTVLTASLFLAAIGTGLLPAVHHAGPAIGPLVSLGAGEAGVATAINTLLPRLLPDQERQVRIFGFQFFLINLGQGVGAFVAGEVVSLRHPDTFTVIYLLDALSFLLPGLLVPLLLRSSLLDRGPSRARAAKRAAAAPRAIGSSYREVLANAGFVRYVVLLGALYLVGYSSLDAGFVGFSTTVIHVSPRLVADAFAINTAVIVVFQQLFTRRVARIRRSTALAFAALAFGAAWLVELFASELGAPNGGKVLVLAFGAVFAVGEMVLSPVRNVLANAFAKEELRGRYNALSFAVTQSSNIVAPAVIGVVLGVHAGHGLVIGLVVLCAAVAMLASRFGRVLTREQNNEPLPATATPEVSTP